MVDMIFGPDGIIVIVVAAIVLIFGGSKLPALARGLGSASHEFRKGVAEGDPTRKELPLSVVKVADELRKGADKVEDELKKGAAAMERAHSSLVDRPEDVPPRD